MRNFILTLIFLFSISHAIAQENKPTMMITGASFAVKENGWFEISCDAFRANAINKAISGSSIKDAAKAMLKGNLYTTAELEATDAFVVMHVHNQEVANTSKLKEDYTQYTEDEINADYSVAYDYLIKKYMSDCENLKNSPTSKYYQTEAGKPATIILCTHWHDSRTLYNSQIRTLASKWNLPLVKWDDNIGFTKDILDEDGKQASLKYSGDTESMSGVTYGWHPLRGKNQYIQQKMAEIFVIEMQNILGTIPVSVSAQAKSNVIREGEDAYVKFAFTGLSPWNLSYKVDNNQFDLTDISENPYTVKLNIPAGSEVDVTPLSVSNATSSQGTVSSPISIGFMNKAISVSADTHIHQANKGTAYYSATALDLKIINSDNYSREIFVTFNIESFDDLDNNIALRLYLDDLIYSGTTVEETHLIEVSGKAQSYANLTWNNQPTDLEKITEAWILPSEKKSYVAWNVSDWVILQKEARKTVVTFKLKITSGGSGLLRFPSMEATTNKPELLATTKMATGIQEDHSSDLINIYPNPFADIITVSSEEKGLISIYSVDGQMIYQSAITEGKSEITTSDFPTGMYILNFETTGKSITNKLIKTQ